MINNNLIEKLILHRIKKKSVPILILLLFSFYGNYGLMVIVDLINFIILIVIFKNIKERIEELL